MKRYLKIEVEGMTLAEWHQFEQSLRSLANNRVSSHTMKIDEGATMSLREWQAEQDAIRAAKAFQRETLKGESD